MALKGCELNDVISTYYKAIAVPSNNQYFINALARFKAEELAKEPIISCIRQSDYARDKVVMNELSVSLIQEQFDVVNSNSRNRIDIAIANNDTITDIIEVKIAYLGEFFTDSNNKEFLVPRKPNRQIPSGIHTSITPNKPGIVEDIIKRHNDHCNILGLYIVKEIEVLKDVEDIEYSIVNKDLLVSSPSTKYQRMEIKQMIKNSLNHSSNPSFIRNYQVADPLSLNLGKYKDDFNVTLHFYTISSAK